MFSRSIPLLVIVALSCAACGERSTEYRLRSERATEKTNSHDDLIAENAYTKYRDRLWRKRHIEEQQRNQEEATRVNRAKKGIKDGSLMERYTLAPGEVPADDN